MIYFDHAATSLMRPNCVGEAIQNALQTSGNAGRGAHSFSLTGGRIIHEAREEIAEFFHAQGADSVVFTGNATESLNTVIFGLFDSGDHIITTEWEHNSVLRPLYLLEERGVEITILPWENDIQNNLERIKQNRKKNTKAIICTHASNVTGMVTDIEKIGTFAREHGFLFIVDIAQTAGILPIDMEKMSADILCFSGHKGLFGPQGTGGICLGKGICPRPLKVGGSGIESFRRHHPKSLPSALEAGTLNSHGIAGLCAGISYLKTTGIPSIYEKSHQYMEQFLQGITPLKNVKCYGDFTKPIHLPIVSMNINGINSGVIEHILYEEYDIAVRSGIHCAPMLHKHFQTEATGMVRFSFSHFNTEAEIKTAVEAVQEISASFE